MSATPIYDALCAEYRRLFRALPGDRSGEEGTRFTAFGAGPHGPLADGARYAGPDTRHGSDTRYAADGRYGHDGRHGAEPRHASGYGAPPPGFTAGAYATAPRAGTVPDPRHRPGQDPWARHERHDRPPVGMVPVWQRGRPVPPTALPPARRREP
ncbi:hypothetical protein JNUCC64_27900 [Streptomyces sp. JNUCC 64]